jgi:hypothetical protein
VEDLTVGSLAYVQPGPLGRWGISWKTFGNKVYKENICGLSFGTALTSRFFLGATGKIFLLNITGYGFATSNDIDLGCILKIGDGTYGGLSLFNIFGSRLGECRERLPSQMSFGLRTKMSDELVLMAEIQKETGHEVHWRAGYEYRISQYFFLRGGLMTTPSELTGGAGFCLGPYRFDYAFVSHSVLGMTHYVSMTVGAGSLPSDPGLRR